MSDYRAPLEDMRFTLEAVAGLESLTALPGYEDATPELVEAVLAEAAKLAEQVIAPLNQPGDATGSQLENGVVRTPKGFREAYAAYVEGGWNALPFERAYGGEGLPRSVALAVQELWNSANMAFALCPLLNQSAVELLQVHGSPEQKRLYLGNMVSGRWSGTMNLTEPQAGSDVGAVKTRAVPQGDHYLLTGQKIFITYGEHDLAENIIHMVLARAPGAPEGTRGLSLFLVPKMLLDGEGRPAGRNDLRCVSLEHKLGIKASPTCVMAFGDSGGAVGYLVGEVNRGMECMFTMMNNARISVGVQGVSIAERAYQAARDHARLRLQGRGLESDAGQVPIIGHPDVRRMLAHMKAGTEAARALAYYTAAGADWAARDPDNQARERARIEVLELLTPVVKAWCSDIGCEVASLGIQVHGGVGFIEDSGAPQHYRDARIAPIYEGTNGIQALDLLGRKVLRLKGAPAQAFAARIERFLAETRFPGELKALVQPLTAALTRFKEATDWLLETNGQAPRRVSAGAVPYLQLMGWLAGGWLLAEKAVAAARNREAGRGDLRFLDSKITLARFYAEALLPRTAAAAAELRGAAAALDLPDEAF